MATVNGMMFSFKQQKHILVCRRESCLWKNVYEIVETACLLVWQCSN